MQYAYVFLDRGCVSMYVCVCLYPPSKKFPATLDESSTKEKEEGISYILFLFRT